MGFFGELIKGAVAGALGEGAGEKDTFATKVGKSAGASGGVSTSGDGLKDTSLLKDVMARLDTGFYGHNKVEGGKQDGSGFYKHQKKVGQTLF
jgi:hypothetical protein